MTLPILATLILFMCRPGELCGYHIGGKVMGGFIPSPNDQEIVAKLNYLFSGAQLAAIKAFTDKNNKRLFPAKNLSRVARRIGAYPNTTNDQYGRNPRARWYLFLEKLPTTTKSDINNLLKDATDPANGYDGVVFDLT